MYGQYAFSRYFFDIAPAEFGRSNLVLSAYEGCAAVSHLTTDVNVILIDIVQSAKVQAQDTLYNTKTLIFKKEKGQSCGFLAISIKIYFNKLSSTCCLM